MRAQTWELCSDSESRRVAARECLPCSMSWFRILNKAVSSFVAACVRYSSQLRIPNETLISLARIDESYGKLGIIVNDIHSFEKELALWNKDHKEGARLLNIVNTMSIEAGVSYSTAKRILWFLCREWEIDHQEMVARALEGKAGSDPALKLYLKGLEYVLSGNEHWSETTERYHWRD